MALLHHPSSFASYVKDARGLEPEERAGRTVDSVWDTLRTEAIERFSFNFDRRGRLKVARGLSFSATSGGRSMAPGHTHPVVAASRSDASVFITKIATALGKRRYDLSISAREARGLAAGARSFRVTKDLLSDPRQDRLWDDDLVSMVDTDYYLSEDDLLKYAGHDMAFYTLVPDGLAGYTEDSAWAFVSRDTVVEEVAGGARYRHQVWDWTGDFVVLGGLRATHIYDVIRYPVAPGRAVILLLLARTISLPLQLVGWLMPDIWAYKPRRYAVEEHKGYLVALFGHPNDKHVHIHRKEAVGQPRVSIPWAVYDAFVTARDIPNTDRKDPVKMLLPAAVERLALLAGLKLKPTAIYLLSAYFTEAYKPMSLANYQASGPLQFEDGVPNTVVAAVPLGKGHGFGPVSSSNNERRALDARVEACRNGVDFPLELVEYGKEFAGMVVPQEGMGVPLSIEELRELQDKSAQVARRLAEDRFPSQPGALKTSSFQKKETYTQVADPRLINQVPTDHTNRLCGYSAAIKGHLREKCGHWYMVGKNPEQIAQGIQALHERAGPLAGADYSRMDGRTSVAYRDHVLQPVYMRYFGSAYHEELSGLLEAEKSARTTTAGHKHKAKFSGANLSGSGITTDLNTLDAAFNEYVARRRAGQEPSEAYGSLGCYFGDDSVVQRGILPAVKSVAASTGMVCTEEETPEYAGPGFVRFLSRVYPDIRTSHASHPCVERALKKICTVQCPQDAPDKQVRLRLKLKVEGLLVGDGHVPILSDYARALKRVYQLDELRATEAEWSHAVAQEKGYRVKKERGAYPFSAGDEDLLLASVAQEMGISVEEGVLLRRRLESARTKADLLACSMADGEVEVPAWARLVPTPARL